ncbi:MAG: DUF2231 domain-containing protein [Jatrophihabitantaceae bacterium]
MSHTEAKHPVSAVLAGPYGHPFHPILVTVPIGAWVSALIFDISSHIVDNPGFLSQGAEWLIAIGVLGALAAAMVGFLDLFAIPAGTRAFRTALIHMSLNLAITGAYVGNFFWRHSTYTDGRAVPGGPLALAVVSLAVLGVSGFLGGKLAYHYGVRVADEQTQADGYSQDPTRAQHAARPTT